MILSLRTRLITAIIAAVAVLLAVLSLTVYHLTTRTLLSQFDGSLASTAELLAAAVEAEYPDSEDRAVSDEESHVISGDSPYKLEFEFDVALVSDFAGPGADAYYEFFDATGKPLHRSPSLGQRHLASPTDQPENVNFRTLTLPDSTPSRAVQLDFIPRAETDEDSLPPPELSLVVARDASAMYKHFAFLKALLASLSLAVLLLSAVAAAIVTKLSLKPIHTLAGRIAGIDPDNLGAKFEPRSYPAELRPICNRLNGAVDRLGRSFDRERRFNADIAHELRTPLAGLQSTIEVALARPRDTAEYSLALRDCLSITETMQRLIDTLLAVSRLEAGQITLNIQSIRPAEMLDSLWLDHADKARDRSVDLENRIDPSLSIKADPDRLTMILSNLLENAAVYSDPGTFVRADAGQAEDALTVTISNTASNLAPDDLPHIFDFFWRKDTARTQVGKHCGVGLSVAAKIAKILDIPISTQLRDNTFQITLTFNRAV